MWINAWPIGSSHIRDPHEVKEVSFRMPCSVKNQLPLGDVTAWQMTPDSDSQAIKYIMDHIMRNYYLPFKIAIPEKSQVDITVSSQLLKH